MTIARNLRADGTLSGKLEQAAVSGILHSHPFSHEFGGRRHRKGHGHPEIASLTGIGPAKLVASVGHDSAAAVAAIPGFGKNKLYISIGTRSAWESKLTSLWYLRPLIRAALRTPAASPAER